MQRISRAPELSATFSLDSCWIIALLRLLQDLDQAPALRLRKGSGLDHADRVALAGLVALVVRMQRARTAHDLLVGRVAPRRVNPHRDRFLAFVGDDDPLPHLGGVGVMLGHRRPRPGALLGLGGSPFLAPFRPTPLALLGPSHLPLLRSLLRLRLVRPPRALQATLLLPGKIVLGVRLRRLHART